MNELITVSKLTKCFGEKCVFRGLDLVFPSQKVCIMGPSGCGKTTLSRIIAGLDNADGGEIHGIYGDVSLMFQEHRLFPSLSAKNNVFCVCKSDDSKKRAIDLLHSLGLTNEDIEKKPSQLSGGMNQRVSLVRALIFSEQSGGNTIILDEPFKALDGETKEKAIEAVLKLSHGKNLIVITHDPSDAELLGADILNLGTII